MLINIVGMSDNISSINTVWTMQRQNIFSSSFLFWKKTYSRMCSGVVANKIIATGAVQNICMALIYY